ncbi:MAG TPA: hypothetical protein VFO76_05265 [Candidatus Kapabacteria bacterium]|nr:hypothetical protein [Candidatus Kapabacteria bacterium]
MRARNRSICFVVLAFVFLNGYFSALDAQPVEEPQILILTPNQVSYDPSFEKEIKNQTELLRKKIDSNPIENILNSPEFLKLPDARKKFFLNFKTFYERLDFFKNIALICGNYLSYTFAEKFPNPLITMNDIHTAGSVAELRAIHDSVGLQYIINFPSVRLYKDSGKAFAKITMQLYDGQTGAIAFSKEYIGGWDNPGFEFACEDSTLSCTINNALSQALAEVVGTVTFLSPRIRYEKQIAQERYLLLINRYYSAPFDEHIINSAIPKTDSLIDPALLFQCLYDSSHTKFVGFYSAKMGKLDFAAMQKNKKDKWVNIKVDHDLNDPAFFDDIPQTYAYLVCGVRYDGKWFYQKMDVTYFNPKDSFQGKLEYFNSSLQDHHFFIEHTTDLDPQFWETDLFEKIKDLRKDPQWAQYGTGMWKNEERENRPYIGMYKVVADALRKDRDELSSRTDTAMKKSIFMPFYERYLSNSKDVLGLSHQTNSFFTYIYPIDRSVVLNPVVIEDKNHRRVIRYFVYLPAEKKMYEWTYLQPKIIDSNSWYATEIIASLKSTVDWNYSYSTLDDPNFWNTYVLKQEDKKYKYLKPLP